MLDGMIQMLQFLVPDPPHRHQQLLQILRRLDPLHCPLPLPLQQLPHLIVVVLADLGLDGLGAGHGSLASEEGGGPAEGGGGDGPDRVHGGRSDTVLSEEVAEDFEVAIFLIVHVLHERSEMGVCADDGRRLGGVDEDGSEFTGVIDSELFANG